ncbi:15-hydroxyprostaglandin dehydrogenase [NAD(+)]-like [Schistocerca nitens]|uniref:15-hydroxyprostaglandin dehydrogenase [NAD(+)]-like n=1 Tax=Schistocerca nitens TaxID=7011 RepID=UPI00211787E7|nr:15-hydroxyprostaglandin dehydrogenase [NAD(+)]-like [Schistocerca nitens]
MRCGLWDGRRLSRLPMAVSGASGPCSWRDVTSRRRPRCMADPPTVACWRRAQPVTHLQLQHSDRMDPSGKVALITGAAGGLGRAFSRALLTAGAKIVASDADEAAGKKAVAELEKQFGKGKVIFVKADVTNSSSLEEAFKAAKSTFNRLDIVVNNAGIMRDSVWEKEIDINVKGVVYGILLAYKYMGKQNGGAGGVVVNLSSVAGLDEVPQLPIYCGTKHAVSAMTRSYGDELHVNVTGVRMVALCPGPTDTPLVNDAHHYCLHDYVKQSLIDVIPSYGPLNTPDFIAQGMMTAIREGKSGSVWMANNNKIKEIVYQRLVQ